MKCRCRQCGKRLGLRILHLQQKLKCPRCGAFDWQTTPPCNCGMYHFPHRKGGGICMHNPNLTEEDFDNAVAAMRNRKTYNMD